MESFWELEFSLSLLPPLSSVSLWLFLSPRWASSLSRPHGRRWPPVGLESTCFSSILIHISRGTLVGLAWIKYLPSSIQRPVEEKDQNGPPSLLEAKGQGVAHLEWRNGRTPSRCKRHLAPATRWPLTCHNPNSNHKLNCTLTVIWPRNSTYTDIVRHT